MQYMYIHHMISLCEFPEVYSIY